MSIPELQKQLEENPESWFSRLKLVEALVAEGRHESAVEVVNNGQALPREPSPWLDAAKCYAAVGAMEQARSLVASSLEIDPAFEPALTYQKELEAAIAEMPVALSADDVDDEQEAVAVVADDESTDAEEAEVATAEEVPAPSSAPAPTPTALIVEHGDTDEPITLPRVSFENHEMEALLAAEEESRRQNEAWIRRDKMNSVLVTIVLHVVIIVGLMLVATKVPPRVPPQIVASSANQEQEEQIENVTMEKPTVDPTTAVNSSVADIISVNAESSFSVSNLDVPISDVAMTTAVSFSPSMSIGMPTSSESKMMFGQEMEGEVLGVILDVSGSMAEFLPMVVREVDKNFKDAPIVYVRNMLLNSEKSDIEEVRLIVPEEVIPYNKELKTRTPYWFLWHDLPRKAPQRYVDRLIEMYKTRPNSFITIGNWNHSRVISGVDFLMEQNIDSLYIFSDFEDFVDEDIALTLGQKLGRRKIRTYVQPAEKTTEFLDIMTKKVASRTLGRQMPSLTSILGGGGMDGDKDEPTSLLPQKPEKKTMEVDFDFTYATPRPEITGDKFWNFRPSKDWKEIHRLSEPEYDAIFYGPEARAYIFLKDDDGNYIQNPISFYYHSWKEFPEHPDPRYRVRRRKFLRLEEEPKFDGKDFTWKMILEDEVKFEVQLYLGSKGMSASYAAEIPKEGTGDNPFVYFRIPGLAQENKDRYYGNDFPVEGVKLDDVRKVVHPNELIIDLPRELRDSRGTGWSQLGFEPGYNTVKFDQLVRHFPSGIRDMVIQGPSFGPRVIHFRTTSNKVLLTGGAGRADIEPWESFWGSIRRPNDRREGFRKSEAILIEIK